LPRLRSRVRDSFPAPASWGRASALPSHSWMRSPSRSPVRLWGRSQPPGGVAEWSCSGLQSRLRRFDSDPRLQKFAFRVRLLALCLASISSFSRQRPAWSSTRLLTKRKSLECPSRLGQCQLAHLPSPRLPRRTTVSGKKKPTSQTARKGTLATGRVRFTGTELLAVQLLPSWPKVLSPQQYAAPAFGLVKLLMITVHVWRPPALTVAKFKPPTIAVGVALPALPVVEPVIETDGSGRSSDVRFANGQINSLAPEAAS
jgi:hypothetical protein